MKIKRLQAYIKKEGLSCVVLVNLDDTPSTNFLYFTDYKGYGCLVVPKTGKPVLVVPKMEEGKARIAVKKSKFRLIVAEKTKSMLEPLKGLCRGKKIGIDYDYVTIRLQKAIKKNISKKQYSDVSEACLSVRAIKSRQEIICIKRACAIADSILQKCFRNFNKFKTELDVKDFLVKEISDRDCVVSFEPIVASGSNGAMPHHEPGKIKLKKGFCVIDFGVKYKGYCSDMTRTIYIGKPSKSDIDYYNFMLKSQNNMISYCRVKRLCSDIFDFAVKELGDYAEYFTHGLGHGVGLQIHELPNLKPKSNEILQNGMVFTIEPGTYFAGKYGIRIEDVVLMSGSKSVVLSRTSKKLKIFNKK